MEYQCTGIADHMLRFVEENQLKDRELWKLVAEQYASSPDDADLGWRGEYWGKLMRGACMTWQYTRDEELYQILSEAVEQLLACQEPDGRISTYSREAEFQGWDMWCRKYVLLGLLHFYEICTEAAGRERVLKAASRHLDYIIGKVGREEDGKRKITRTSHIWGGINSSSILEPVVRLYKLNPRQEYLDFAAYIVEEGGADEFDIFQAAYEDKLYPYQYPVVKAYELMSCFEGLAEYAEVTENEKWRTAVVCFAQKLLESEATIVGGSGCKHELFNHSTVMQTDTEYNGLMLETCVTVTWMKLLYRVYLLTGESRYLDEIERSAYNALYGAINTENATCGSETTFDLPEYRQVYDRHVASQGGKGQIFDSYSPLRADIRGRAVGGFKSIRDGDAFCGCCVAIGAAGTALVPKAGARVTEKGLEIGMYLPGRIQVEVPVSGQVALQVHTRYPAIGEVLIKVESISGTSTGGEADFVISLRIPGFAAGSTVSVNGEAVEGVAEGSFLKLFRCWKEGDEVVISLSMNPRLAYGNGHVAVLYGPLALARDRRLGCVGTPVPDPVDNFSLKPWDGGQVPFPCQCAFEVQMGEEKFFMVDYASAGKSWRRDTELETWMALGM